MNGSGIRSLTALYVAAPLSMGYVDCYTFLMPLYALSPGFDADVGILVGARSIVASFLSIHIGVLMDRFGTRKITPIAGAHSCTNPSYCRMLMRFADSLTWQTTLHRTAFNARGPGHPTRRNARLRD
jgi:MFS family permease